MVYAGSAGNDMPPTLYVRNKGDIVRIYPRKYLGRIARQFPARHAEDVLDAGGLSRVVTHRFDIVAVGINHKGPVIVGVIVRPEARRSVILSPGGKRGAVKRHHLVA